MRDYQFEHRVECFRLLLGNLATLKLVGLELAAVAMRIVNFPLPGAADNRTVISL